MNRLYLTRNKGDGRWLISAPNEDTAIGYSFYALKKARRLPNISVEKDTTDYYMGIKGSDKLKEILESEAIYEMFPAQGFEKDILWFCYRGLPEDEKIWKEKRK